ncbi:VENN motif pre-toxin domain-containing protein, partial [Pasteurella multocida]
DKIANTLAHAIWGAIEATANRGNPTSGAIAAASAELAAPMLAKVLYNKDKAEHLTAEEKAQITALSSITAAVAGGLTAQGSSQRNTTVSSLTHASIGGEIGKIAVENNYLSLKDISAYQRALKKAIQNGESVEEVHEYFKALSEKQRAALVANCNIDCRVTVPNELLAAIGFADGLSGLLNSWVMGLPLDEQTKFYQLVEAENIKTIQALKDKQGSVEKGVELAMDMAHFFSKGDNVANSSSKVVNFSKKTTKYNFNSNSINNMKEFLNKDGFGSELGKIVSKTSKQYHGQSIYEVNKNGLGFRKGDQIYLDGMHKDHFEVFDKKGNFKGVYNLDGTLNESKTKSGQNRKLNK